jgi:hypothetical protein
MTIEIPTEFQNILFDNKSKNVDTKDFIAFLTLYSEFKYLEARRIEEEVEPISQHSFQKQVIRWYYSYFNIFEQVPERLIQPEHQRYVYNVKKNNVRIYEERFNFVRDKIISGEFTQQGFNTKTKKSFNQLFSLNIFKDEIGKLSAEDQQRLYDVYSTKYDELRRGVNIDRRNILAQANEKVYDQYLADALPDNLKLASKQEIERFIRREFPLALDQIDTIFTVYYNKYTTTRERFQRPRPQEIRNENIANDENVLKYPFRSKVKKFEKMINKNGKHNVANMNIDTSITKDRDYRLKPLKNKFSRPSFAYYPNSWEIDHIQHSRNNTYLFAININTRYLYTIKVRDKTSDSTRLAINKLIEMERTKFNKDVRNIRGDGDKGFQALIRIFPDINFYFQSSKFTYHNKIIDAVIRTMRNALGVNSDKYWDGNHDDVIQQLTNYYNNTYHRVIKMTPFQMHKDIELEWEYIRNKTEELNDVKKRQFEAGLKRYKEGDRLLVYLDLSKTPEGFSKRRRNFDRYATFIEYENGNCKVRLDNPIYMGMINGVRYYKDVHILPIFYTKRIK